MTIKTVLAVMAAPAALLVAPVAAQDMDDMDAVQDRRAMTDDRMGDRDAMPMQDDAQVVAGPMAPKPDAMAIKAEDFVLAAAHSGHFEIESSTLALEKAESEEVRDFAARMIDQHVAMNRKLKEVAGMDVPAETGPAQKLVVAKLSDASGTDFETGYIKAQITGHELTATFFEAVANSDADPALVEYAQMGLPKIKEHLEEAKDIARSMGAM